MIHCNPKDIYKPWNVSFWMLLSIKAGYLNAAGFLATGKFVSHVTGFGTQMGVSIAHKDYFFGGELLIIPLAFILGSSVPAWLLDHRYNEKRVPKYYQVQVIITVFLAILFYLGISGAFGEFTTAEEDFHDIVIVGLLCFICGMKNGLSTWATNGKIRTTHLTGLSTDIGLNLPKFFRKSDTSRFPEHPMINTVRILTFLSFSTGSLVAAFVFPQMEFMGFVFPLILSIIISFISITNYRRHIRNLNMSKDRLKIVGDSLPGGAGPYDVDEAHRKAAISRNTPYR